MESDTNRVIVSVGAGATAGGVQVHHHDFPEIRTHGQTPADAATQLQNQLTRALDSALTAWRRESIEKALEDVRTFLAAPPAGG